MKTSQRSTPKSRDSIVVKRRFQKLIVVYLTLEQRHQSPKPTLRTPRPCYHPRQLNIRCNGRLLHTMGSVLGWWFRGMLTKPREGAELPSAATWEPSILVFLDQSYVLRMRNSETRFTAAFILPSTSRTWAYSRKLNL